MKVIIKIAKSILIYLACYMVINFLFCLAYYYMEFKGTISLQEVLVCSLSGILSDEIKQRKLLIVLSVQRFAETICLTVLTGYIFAYILNRESQIILPDKLVIRHRTSENVNHLLTLGILVGNKSRFKVHDVKCTVSCFYLKKKSEPLLTNSEFQIVQEVHTIDNYFRFSFELRKFPRKVLQDFVNKDTLCLEIDTISVSISGHSNILGNTFLISKKYKLTDLIIDEHVPQVKYSIKNPLTKKKIFEFIKWDELNRMEEVSEKKRVKTIDEIKDIIKKTYDKSVYAPFAYYIDESKLTLAIKNQCS